MQIDGKPLNKRNGELNAVYTDTVNFPCFLTWVQLARLSQRLLHFAVKFIWYRTHCLVSASYLQLPSSIAIFISTGG